MKDANGNDVRRIGEAMNVHVCAPAPEQVKMLRGYCHNCRQSRRFIVAFFAWYDPLETCLRCGEKYSGNERLERPFASGWRKRSICRAWQSFRAYKLGQGER